MLESGVKIGAVRNLDAVGDRIRLYRAKVLSPNEAQMLGYQTVWSAIIPDPDIPPRKLTRAELVSLTTPRADSRINPVFFKVIPSTMAQLEAMRPAFSDTTPRLEDGPVLELAPGIDARLSIIRQDPDRPTTARNRIIDNPQLSENPQFPSGASVGLHIDDQKDLPVATRETDDRRGIIVMGSDSGPSTHHSLFVKSYNVFDLASMVHPGDREYIPINSELSPRLISLIEGKEEIVDVEMESGEAMTLMAVTNCHDGGPNRLRRAYTAVTYEPQERWSKEALLANSLFN